MSLDENPSDIQYRYWQKLNKYVENHSRIKCNKIEKGPRITLTFNSLLADMHLAFKNSPNEAIVRLHITNKEFYTFVFNQKETIEKELNQVLNWNSPYENKDSYNIELKRDIEFYNESKWQEYIEWHVSNAEKFIEIFFDKIDEFEEDIKQIRTLTLSDTNQDSLSYEDAVNFLSDILINERDCHYHYYTPFNLLGKTLVLFKYKGKLIGKGIILEKVSEKVIQDGDEYNGYYIVDKDSISIFNEPVGLEELNNYIKDINTLSRDQIIDLKYLNEVNKMIEDHQDPYNRIASKIRDYLDDNNLGDLSSEETERNISYFKSKFSPEILKELNGMDVLNTIFLHDGDKNNLCYNLEFNNRYSFAGSIKGGTAFKYSLFKSNKNQQWVSGSSLNQISLTVDEAIEEGTKIRDALVKGADLIEKTDLNTIKDYDNLENELNKIFSNSECSPSNSWVHKYYVLLFPEKFPCMHSNQMKVDTIKKLNLEVEDGFYAQDSQFYLIAKKAGIKLYSIFDGRIERLFNLFVEEEDDGLGDSDVKTVNYWIYSPGAGAEHWEEFYNQNILAIGWDGTGDLNDFSTKEDIKLHLQEIYNDQFSHRNDVLALWQFANEIQVGDIIYAKKGMSEIIGKGIIEGEYLYDSSRDYYKHVRKIKWTDKGNWPYDSKLPMKTLTNITNYTNMVNTIKSHFESDEIIIEEEETYPPYTEEDFLDDVYISEDKYNTLKDLLSIKKNLIIQGPPGVGKTFMAKRLAYSIMGEKNQERCLMVQFHQSYSYEDFIQGFRPSKDGFNLKNGSFYEFCKRAEDDDENKYFFIIDEINRGNLSKIFGELFMLIENDKRGEKNKIRLVYSDELFYIPKNVYIIGLMNTADRSLAMLDYALRRRFRFFTLTPGFDSTGFKNYQKGLASDKFNKVIDLIKELNVKIAADETLGAGFTIGHSYFCNLKDERDLKNIIDYEIIPLLEEYWFDEPDKVKNWSENLRSVLNENSY